MVRVGLGHEGAGECWRGEGEEDGVGVTGREGGREKVEETSGSCSKIWKHQWEMSDIEQSMYRHELSGENGAKGQHPLLTGNLTGSDHRGQVAPVGRWAWGRVAGFPFC